MSESEGRFSRTERMLGSAAMTKLANASVILFGVGGVGGFVAEALARSGIGKITLLDKDDVDITNINRQIVALTETVGRSKCDVMRERILSINPGAQVTCHKVFYLPENADDFDLSSFDYVVDAVDTVSAKLEIILRSKKAGVPVISAMGAGNKTDPTKLEVADISRTSVCPLARTMRRELKQRGIQNVKVVYSREEIHAVSPVPQAMSGKVTPASNAFVPSVMGLIIAREVVFDLISSVVE